MLECRHFAVALPKLYVVAVYKLLSVFCRGVIVGAQKLNRSQKLAIGANDIGPVICHLLLRRRRPHAPACMSNIAHFQQNDGLLLPALRSSTEYAARQIYGLVGGIVGFIFYDKRHMR